MRGMCAAVLALESVALFLTAPVLIALTDVGTAQGWAIGIGLALLCVLGAGLMRPRPRHLDRPPGSGARDRARLRAAGDVRAGRHVQRLWILAIVLGRRVDEAKAARANAAG
jgi:hypothetical protein